MTPGWVENLSDGPKIVHGPVFYINLEFETCGAGIWEKKLNLGPSKVRTVIHIMRDRDDSDISANPVAPMDIEVMVIFVIFIL